MKRVLIIPDGAADAPMPELSGLTPLEAADTPNLDRLATLGRLGTLRTTPPGFIAGSDICCMTLLGYDARTYHTGRAPLEAAALGLSPSPDDWIFRLNFVTTTSDDAGGLMLDHSAGAISDAEARVLAQALMDHWRAHEPALAADCALHPGVSYRCILVDRSGRDYRGSSGGPAALATIPPHEIPHKPWRASLPRGAHASQITRLMELSRECLARHEVNIARVENGLRPASMAWIWGQGLPPRMPAFKERFGVRAAISTAVDLLAGIAAYTGIERLPIPGLTSYHDNDYEAQGRFSAAALDRYDMVIVHVEAPDEASHQGDWQTKVRAIEQIDRHIIGPIMERLGAGGAGAPPAQNAQWRMLVLPDHYTLCATLKHDATPPPFLIAGANVQPGAARRFSEPAARDAAWHIDQGHMLMERFVSAAPISPE